MSDAILVAIITGGLSLLGIIYSSGKSASKVDAKLDKQQAVIETKLNELTREVREHNNFARLCLWLRNRSRSSTIVSRTWRAFTSLHDPKVR